jgi:hypothetical protein
MKLGKMQDTQSSLGFVPGEDYVESTFTAIEDDPYWPDDSSPLAAISLAEEPLGDLARPADGYPAEFVTPPSYVFSYFGEDGLSSGKAAGKKQIFINRVVAERYARRRGASWVLPGRRRSVMLRRTLQPNQILRRFAGRGSPCIGG